MYGYVSNIQRFSLHDGPGIRTTVFLAGCNLRCWWCHNPEAIEMSSRLQFFKVKCTACCECVTVCTHGAQQFKDGLRLYDRAACVLCGKCVENCSSGALKYSCQPMEDNKVMEEILKDRAFYANTGGGVTFSGGEPFMQIEFLINLMRMCRELGLKLAVETAGNIDYELILKALPYIDTVICDMKAFDSELHVEGTGIRNNRILDNIEKLSRDAKELWIRIPIVPGYNDNSKELSKMAAFLKPIAPAWVELIPFHRMGQSKYESLLMPYAGAGLTAPDEEVIAEYARIFHEYGLNVKNKI